MISMVQGISAAWHRAGPTQTRLVSYRPRMPEWMKARMRYAKTASVNPLLDDRQRQREIRWAVLDLVRRAAPEYGLGFVQEIARMFMSYTDCPRDLFIEVVGVYDPDEAARLWEEWGQEVAADWAESHLDEYLERRNG